MGKIIKARWLGGDLTQPAATFPPASVATAGRAVRMSPGSVTADALNLEDLHRTGESILDAARQQAAKIIETANAEAQQIAKTARAEGFQAGQKLASADADKKIQTAAAAKTAADLKTLQAAAAAQRAAFDQWMSRYAGVLGAITVEAVQKVTLRDLSAASGDNHLVVRWAAQAVASVRAAKSLRLAVHPETLADLGDHLDRLMADPHLPEDTAVVPDDSLAVGDVVVRQDGGEIHAGLSGRIAQLVECLPAGDA